MFYTASLCENIQRLYARIIIVFDNFINNSIRQWWNSLRSLQILDADLYESFFCRIASSKNCFSASFRDSFIIRKRHFFDCRWQRHHLCTMMKRRTNASNCSVLKSRTHNCLKRKDEFILLCPQVSVSSNVGHSASYTQNMFVRQGISDQLKNRSVTTADDLAYLSFTMIACLRDDKRDLLV
jgi:hypothetical protein